MNAAPTLVNARIVTRTTEQVGALRVADGTIAAIEPGVCRTRGEDLGGDYLIPGLVELHTDVLERHAVPRPGVRWPELAAVIAYDAQLATAGITTVLDSLSVGHDAARLGRPRDPRVLVDAARGAQAEGLLRAEHFRPFAGDPLVRLVSLMDHAPGQRQFTSLDKYREYYQGKYALTDVEMDAFTRLRLAEQARYAEPHREAIAALAKKHGHVLASHDDATVAHIEEAARAGAVIAEFPTTVEAARAARQYWLAILVGAPNLVRGASHSGNIAAAELAAEGLVDILASDYVPASALHAAVLLHRRHGFALPEAIATVTRTPARRVGLEDRGEIAPGLRADLVRVRLSGDLPVVIAVWRRGVRVA